MKNKFFKCAYCGGVFKKGWSDEEAKKEFDENWNEEDFNDAVQVCDDCYKIMNPENEENIELARKHGFKN